MDNNIVKKLRTIAQSKSFNNTTTLGTKKRIQFLILLHKYRLFVPIKNNELFDQYSLSERTIDTCFEMYDGDDVLYGLLEYAKNDSELIANLQQHYSKETIQTWQNKFKNIPQETQLILC